MQLPQTMWDGKVFFTVLSTWALPVLKFGLYLIEKTSGVMIRFIAMLHIL